MKYVVKFILRVVRDILDNYDFQGDLEVLFFMQVVGNVLVERYSYYLKRLVMVFFCSLRLGVCKMIDFFNFSIENVMFNKIFQFLKKIRELFI